VCPEDAVRHDGERIPEAEKAIERIDTLQDMGYVNQTDAKK